MALSAGTIVIGDLATKAAKESQWGLVIIVGILLFVLVSVIWAKVQEKKNPSES